MLETKAKPRMISTDEHGDDELDLEIALSPGLCRSSCSQ